VHAVGFIIRRSAD